MRHGRGAGIALALALALGPSAAGAGVITSPAIVTVPDNDDAVPVVFDNAFVFAIDVPDGADPSGYSFTLRTVPEAAVAVPMPGALVVLSVTLLALAGLSFRHTCRRLR